jgi:two-component system OmpR family response regulator
MRVLVIEDEVDLLKGLARSLRAEGYAVDTASDGHTGLRKAEDTPYDALILDVMLPGMDGWELLQSIRETKKTPVLMLTARDGRLERIRGLDLGADDYLVKPFDLGELLARLRAIIRRASGEARSVMRMQDVTIDAPARRVTKAGVDVELTAREYALLEYLAAHRGKVVTRTELYDHLFDEQEDSLSNLLDVHVSNLRKKLGHSLIVTRRGHGYTIEKE